MIPLVAIIAISIVAFILISCFIILLMFGDDKAFIIAPILSMFITFGIAFGMLSYNNDRKLAEAATFSGYNAEFLENADRMKAFYKKYYGEQCPEYEEECPICDKYHKLNNFLEDSYGATLHRYKKVIDW